MERVSAMPRVAEQSKSSASVAQFKYYLNGQVVTLTKIKGEEFTPQHWHAIESAHFDSEGHLLFNNPEWHSVWLGAGEEKAVYLITDENYKAFALELLDRATYLEGKLMEGEYFGDVNLPEVKGYKPNPGSLVGHVFGGRGRVREFIYGETLAGPLILPGHKDAYKMPLPLVWLTWLSRKLSRSKVEARYKVLRQQYSDAHEANVVIELLPLKNPEMKSHYWLPLLWSDHDGYPHWRFFRLTPIDVRIKGRRS